MRSTQRRRCPVRQSVCLPKLQTQCSQDKHYHYLISAAPRMSSPHRSRRAGIFVRRGESSSRAAPWPQSEEDPSCPRHRSERERFHCVAVSLTNHVCCLPESCSLPDLQRPCAQYTRLLVLCHVWRCRAVLVGDLLRLLGID